MKVLTKTVAEMRPVAFNFVDKLLDVRGVPAPDTLLADLILLDGEIQEILGSHYYFEFQGIVLPPRSLMEYASSIMFAARDSSVDAFKSVIGDVLATEYTGHVINFLNGYQIPKKDREIFDAMVNAEDKEEKLFWQGYRTISHSRMEAVGNRVGSEFYKYRNASNLLSVENRITEQYRWMPKEDFFDSYATVPEHVKDTIMAVKIAQHYDLGSLDNVRLIARDIFQLAQPEIDVLKQLAKT